MKPNLIFIMADQLRYDVLNKDTAPNLMELLSDSIIFENCYCASPLCVPSRGAIFTGLFPNNNGSLINPWEIKDACYGDVKTGVDNLYSLMGKNWYSIHSGKQHLYTEGGKLEDDINSDIKWFATEKTYKKFLESEGKKQPGINSFFKTLVPEMVDGKITKVSKYSNAEVGCYKEDQKYYFDRYFANNALEGLKRRDKSKPLFLSAMFVAPHPPLEIPEPWYSKFKNRHITLPENVGKYYEYQSPLQMYNITGIVGSHYDLNHWEQAWKVYLGLVSMLDDCIGDIIKELKNQDLYDSSIIIFTSDHGEMLGSHRLFQKMCMYEESVRVPFFMKLPNGYKKAISSTKLPISQLDIMPTICDYLEVRSSNNFDGISLRSFIENGEQISLQRPIFIQYDGNGSRSNFQRCIIFDGYKFIVDFFKDEIFYELYDLRQDRYEKNNLVFDESYDEKILNMSCYLRKHMVETNDMIKMSSIDLHAFRDKYSSFKVRQ